MIMLLFGLCGIIIYLSLRLLLLKQSLRTLRKDFVQVKKNHQAEQHLQLQYPDQDLELLAVEINDFITFYYEKQAIFQRNVKSIRTEITNLSHDLRTPLTSILGYLELLNIEELSKEQKQVFEVVKRRSYQLNDLIEQLYEYARLENHEYSIKLEKVDLYRVVQEHLLGAYIEFENKGIDFSLKLPKEGKPLWIQADSKCMERVLWNLTSNTLKYCSGKANVILKEEQKYVSLIYQSLRGELTEYDILHLFDRFYKKDSARTENQSSGLGLTITRLFVEQMGGSIYAYGDEEFLNVQCKFPMIEV